MELDFLVQLHVVASNPMSIVRFLPVIAVMALLFYLSSLPGDALGLPSIDYFDKLLHSIAYGMLAAAAMHAVPKEKHRHSPWQTAFCVVLFCFAYGITDEFHQSFVPNRMPSGLDLVADVVGAAASTFLLTSERTRRQKKA